MASDEGKRLLDLALSLLSENRPEEALQALDRVGPEGDSNADQLAYRALALAKLGKEAEADSLLRRAVGLAPFDARMNYLLAVQLRESGDVEESRKYAEAARVIDPQFPGLGALLGSLGLDTQIDPRLRLRERLLHPMPGPPEGPVHAFASIEQVEDLWNVTGWGLAAANLIAVGLVWIHMPVHMPAKGQIQGLPFLGGLVPNADPLSIFTILLLLSAIVLCCAWTVVDMLDRRSRFLWLVPFVPLCCFLLLPGMGLALYMSMGRK